MRTAVLFIRLHIKRSINGYAWIKYLWYLIWQNVGFYYKIHSEIAAEIPRIRKRKARVCDMLSILENFCNKLDLTVNVLSFFIPSCHRQFIVIMMSSKWSANENFVRNERMSDRPAFLLLFIKRTFKLQVCCPEIC